MKIDFHCHFYPPKYLEELARSGFSREDTGQSSLAGWHSNEETIAILDDHGVDVAVLSLSSPQVAFPDEGLSLALSQISNDFLVEVCARDPDRFLGLLSVPLVNVRLALEELQRVRHKPGMVGVAVGTNIAGKPLDAPEFYPFYEEMSRLGLPLYVHPVAPPRYANIDGYSLMSIIPYPFETTLCATRLAYSGTLERFPDLKIVLCHLGGALPYLIGRIDYGYDKYEKPRGIVARPPSEYFKRMYFDTALTYTTAQLICAHDTLGPDQLLLGTDLPFSKGRVKPSLAVLEAADLPSESKEKMYEGNAKRLLGMA